MKGSCTTAFRIGTKVITVIDSLVGPNDRFRSSMQPRTVKQHWEIQRDLIDALCELLRWPNSTKDWLLRQVQHHDPIQPASSTRQYRQVYDEIRTGSGTPTLYQLVLHWAANLGQINSDVISKLPEEGQLWLLAVGPMAVVLTEERPGTGLLIVLPVPKGSQPSQMSRSETLIAHKCDTSRCQCSTPLPIAVGPVGSSPTLRRLRPEPWLPTRSIGLARVLSSVQLTVGSTALQDKTALGPSAIRHARL
ncbi:uncharacterized protein B0I36DRAFT_35306 [Microdochium trichocladiopsis]|uniref:Uncharacterized protein n=1 Tax=Microdochium trichocladiopsis TaxID=1682393 RepID=A0A9P8XTV3_9PEZI|nr:uncharacterized protein B0I36DRAFT_35306 [Microdochium trichocladiopsis]KAH7018024.1 hypothetical protein B0I36DRAFT_35306 [Microdochium trichocladiopsis]